MGDGSETTIDVLLVEDNPGDVRLIEEALHGTESTHRITKDGKEALDFLSQRGERTTAPQPSVVLFDLNLPNADRRPICAASAFRIQRRSVDITAG